MRWLPGILMVACLLAQGCKKDVPAGTEGAANSAARGEEAAKSLPPTPQDVLEKIPDNALACPISYLFSR